MAFMAAIRRCQRSQVVHWGSQCHGWTVVDEDTVRVGRLVRRNHSSAIDCIISLGGLFDTLADCFLQY